MKKILYIIYTVLLLAACDKDVHNKPAAGKGFVSVALVWEDKLNSTDEIESINLWIFDKTDALSVNEKYSSAAELALQRFELQAGEITVVAAVNVNEPIESQHSSTPEDLKFELARQCALYEMTFYGSKTAEVVNGESRAVYVPLNDKPHENTFIEGDETISDWQSNGSPENGEAQQ